MDGPNGARKPRRDDEVVVAIEGFDDRGRAVGTASDPSGEYRVRVRGGLPGERVRARVLRRRGHVLDATVLATLEVSPGRIEPRCAHFGVCGGCAFQDLDYAAQLEEKRRMLSRALSGLGLEVPAVVPCDEPWRYRNKMDFTFGSRRWIAKSEPEDAPRGFALGLHPRDQYRKVLSVDSCAIQDERCDAILRDARAFAEARGLSAWDLVAHRGLLRHLVLRSSRATGEILAQLVTSEEAADLVRPYVAELLAAHPEITTLVQTISTRLAVVAAGEREIVLHGAGSIRERLAGLWFRVSAGSFFQTNTAQAEKLVALAVEACGARAGERVLDLYCGAGTLSLPLARAGAEVTGIDVVPGAIADARLNAEANALAARFEVRDALEWLRTAECGSFDAILVDPPRAGLHPSVAPLVARAARRAIVYVSCNPRAAARDLAQLAELGWRGRVARGVDLFPHTPHVECVVRLERNGGEPERRP